MLWHECKVIVPGIQMTPSESPADLVELRAELKDLKKRHPELEDCRSAPEPRPVVCPLCSGSMMPGEATIRGTVLGFLFVG